MKRQKIIPQDAPLVRPAVELSYTVTDIGGQAELKQWKLDQVVKEAAWQKTQEPKRAARRARAISRIENQNTPQIPLTKAQQREIDFTVQDNIKKDMAALGKLLYEPYTPRPKPSFYQRVKSFIKNALFPRSH